MAGCWIDAQGGRCEVHHRTKGLSNDVLLLSPYGQWAHIITVTYRNCKQLLLHHTSLWNSVNIYTSINPINRTTPHLQTSALGYWSVTCSSSFKNPTWRREERDRWSAPATWQRCEKTPAIWGILRPVHMSGELRERQLILWNVLVLGILRCAIVVQGTTCTGRCCHGGIAKYATNLGWYGLSSCAHGLYGRSWSMLHPDLSLDPRRWNCIGTSPFSHLKGTRMPRRLQNLPWQTPTCWILYDPVDS